MSKPQTTEMREGGPWPTTVIEIINSSKTEPLTAVILTLGSPEIGSPAVINMGDVLGTPAEFDAAFHATSVLVQWTSHGIGLSAPPQSAKTGYYFERLGFSIKPDGSVIKVSPDFQRKLP